MPLPDGQKLRRIDVALWLYRNIAGTSDWDIVSPCRLDLDRGLALSPSVAPRLPLLGMTALESNDLIIHLYAKRCRITIEKSP
jgi:hypothetical protein